MFISYDIYQNFKCFYLLNPETNQLYETCSITWIERYYYINKVSEMVNMKQVLSRVVYLSHTLELSRGAINHDEQKETSHQYPEKQ